jgi:hypothetical protein
MIPKAMMPVPTSRARDTMLIAAAGPPVSGNTETVGVAVALAEGLGEPPSDGNGVKGPPVVLAIGEPSSDGKGVKGPPVVLAIGLALGVAVESPPLGKDSHAIPSSSPEKPSRLLGSLVSCSYTACASSWVAKSEQLRSCAKAIGANTSVATIARAANSNTFLKVPPSVDFPPMVMLGTRHRLGQVGSM